MFYIEAQKSLANSDVRDGQVVVVNTPSSPAANSAKKLAKNLNQNPSPGKGSPSNNGKKGNNVVASSSGTLNGTTNSNNNSPNKPTQMPSVSSSSSNDSNSKGKEKEKEKAAVVATTSP